MSRRMYAAAVLLCAGALAAPADGPWLLTDAGTLRPVGSPAAVRPAAPLERVIDLAFAHQVTARHGAALPGGGTLAPDARLNPAIMNSDGQIAFFSFVSGSSRNQGIFTAGPTPLRPIARGCGGPGGGGQPGSCGDPTPMGGRFAGMFAGTWFAPPINDLGDVLFISDVSGGLTSRGLFLYRAAENNIVKVAAVGDPLGGGNTIISIGMGSLNNQREVVFLATSLMTGTADIYHWHNGTVKRLVGVPDPVPGGGTFSLLSDETWHWPDGTNMPVGMVPDINDAGTVMFFGVVANGIAERGIFQYADDEITWFLKAGDPTPIGGLYTHFNAPQLNNAGQVLTLADVEYWGGGTNAAWIVASEPNHLARKVLAFYDNIDGGQVVTLAVARNPFQALDDCGNAVVWCMIQLAGGVMADRLLEVGADGTPYVVAREGDPTPLGGTFGLLQAWPSMNEAGQITVSGYLQGVGGIPSAHFVSSIGNEPGDAGGDGLVSADDFVELEANLPGPGECVSDFGGRVFDFDADEDVDLADVAGFQGAFTS